jgi:hypothetical protein
MRLQRRPTEIAPTSREQGVNWLGAALLFLLFAWTIWPKGLGAISWGLGHRLGTRVARRAFSNPTGRSNDSN